MKKTNVTCESRKLGLQLINAADKGDTEAVKSLLQKDVYIHTQNNEGRCAIVAAAYKNHLEIIDLLIEAGADVNMKDNSLQSSYLISTCEIPDTVDNYTELLKKRSKQERIFQYRIKTALLR